MSVQLNGKNILIVDDDSSLRMLLRKILETVGCVVDEAERVREALYTVQNKLPDLIILDLNMPEHDGFIFLKARLKNQRILNVPILVLSSWSEKSVVEKALALGANQFLEKPLKANLVLEKVRDLFYSQENSSYQFAEGEMPEVTAEINGLLIGYSENQLKISSVARFERGKSLQIKLEHYVKSGGAVLVSKVDHRRVEMKEGLYHQLVTLVGLSNDEKERLREWTKNL